jgi:PASTA domain
VNPNADHVKHLSPDLRQRLEQGLQLFQKDWTDKLMAETLGQMAADHPLRYASVVEMTKLDLAKRWKHGQRVTLEQYLKSYPELGGVHTVSVDLIRSEYAVRKTNGDAVEVAEYAKRFPNQFEAFQRSLQASKGSVPSPVAAAFGAATTGPSGAKTHPARPAPAATTVPKRRARWPWLVGAALLLLLGSFVGWMLYKGGFGGSQSQQASNQVKSLTVKLDVGAGEAVEEPIYLDLGLGFPLWLVSGGSPPNVPFGAVPQKTTANGRLPANSSTTFTFLLAGDPGQDVLNTTPQLLTGVQVGDIRRVGFASLAQQDWELAGFEIQVNGQTLHSAKGLKIRPKQLQEEAMKKLAASNQKAAPDDQERADLLDLGTVVDVYFPEPPPAKGAKAKDGMVNVPNLVGLDGAAVKKKLAEAGLKEEFAGNPNVAKAASQFPAAGMSVKPGTAVGVYFPEPDTEKLTRQQEVQKFLKMGRDAIADKKWVLANQAILHAADLAPKDADVLRAQQEYRTAMDAARAAQTAELGREQEVQKFLRDGRAAIAAKNWDAAASAINNAAKIAPKDADVQRAEQEYRNAMDRAATKAPVAEKAKTDTELDINLRPTYGETNLKAGFNPDPHSVTLRAGGPIKTTHGSVAAYVAKMPDFKLYYDAKQGVPLTFYIESSGPTTVLINLPGGGWVAGAGGGGRGAQVRLDNPRSGSYAIFVGTPNPENPSPLAVLKITERK